MNIKVLFFTALTFFTMNAIVAQDYSDLESIVLNEGADYAKNEGLVVECSDYLLNSPVDVLDKDLNHLIALQFIMRWMEGTPDYMFNLDESITDVTRSDSYLLGVYLASMSKFVIENKDKSKDQDEIKYNAFLMFIHYCEDPAKKVKQKKAIKELIKARDENTLKEYLKIDNSKQFI